MKLLHITSKRSLDHRVQFLVVDNSFTHYAYKWFKKLRLKIYFLRYLAQNIPEIRY